MPTYPRVPGLISNGEDPPFPRGAGPYWGRVKETAPESLKDVGASLWQMIRHPIQTAESLGDVARSVVSILPGYIEADTKMRSNPQMQALRRGLSASPGGQVVGLLGPGSGEAAADPELARGMGEYFKNRYGGLDEFKTSFREDPAGVLADLGAVLSPGAGAGVRVGGNVGRVAQQTQRAVGFMDPVTATARGVGAVGSKVAQSRFPAAVGGKVAEVMGIAPGTGALPIRAAWDAARKGGDDIKALLESMRAKGADVQRIDMGIVAQAERAMAAMAKGRREAYRTGRANLSGRTVDLAPIRERVRGLYKEWEVGPPDARVLRENTPAVKRLREIDKLMDTFESNEWNSVYDLDILKKEIDALMGEASTGAGRSANSMTSTVRNELRREIIRVDPEYKSVMEGYEAAITLEKELGKDLGLMAGHTQASALRRLQQALKDGVNTGFGNRAANVNVLDPSLTPALAGSALRPGVPVGQARIGSPAAAALISGFQGNIPALGYLASSSPRLVGEGTVLAARAANVASPAVRAAAPIAGPAIRTARPFVTAVNAANEARRTAGPTVRALEAQPDATRVEDSRRSSNLTDEQVREQLRQLGLIQ